MSGNHEFTRHVVELLEPFARVESKRMFGGFGIFRQGLMFALIADGNLYLKADDSSRSTFEDEGLSRFSYFKQEKECFLSYYLAPENFFEDPEDCIYWASLAFDAALRSASKNNRKKKN